MTKEQAITAYFKGFGVPAYDTSTVREDTTFPRITYDLSVDDFDRPVTITASIWDRSNSWESVTGIKDAISDDLGRGGRVIDGIVWLRPATPFAQRMTDPDKSIRRIVLNLEAEFGG